MTYLHTKKELVLGLIFTLYLGSLEYILERVFISREIAVVYIVMVFGSNYKVTTKPSWSRRHAIGSTARSRVTIKNVWGS
jgi:hypothetical protein